MANPESFDRSSALFLIESERGRGTTEHYPPKRQKKRGTGFFFFAFAVWLDLAPQKNNQPGHVHEGRTACRTAVGTFSGTRRIAQFNSQHTAYTRGRCVAVRTVRKRKHTHRHTQLCLLAETGSKGVSPFSTTVFASFASAATIITSLHEGHCSSVGFE